MARYIVCTDCEQRWRQEAAAQLDRQRRFDEPPDGVAERYQRGRAKHDMRCDGACAVRLPAGAACCAITVEPPGVTVPAGWEAEYLELDDSAQVQA